MRRGRWIALAALPALLLAGDYFYWRIAVGELRDGFEAWTVQARDAGWDVSHGTVTTSGWPDAAVLRVEALTVTSSEAAGFGGAGWGGDAVLLRTRLTRPDVLEITPVGLRAITFHGRPPIPVSADHLKLRLALRLNAPPRAVDIEAVTLTARIPRLGPASAGHLRLHANLKPDAGRDQAAVTFSASAREISLPAGIRWGLGPALSDIALEGLLNGPLLAVPGIAPRAIAWRDGGGSLELHRIAIGWGAVRLDATATLALDEELQPMGAGTGKIAGYGAALDALAANAVLSRSAAKAAKAVLSLLADTPGNGQPEEVEVPLTLQFRTLSVHQVPLVRFPELDWPDR